MIAELLIGIFLHNPFKSGHSENLPKPQVLAISKINSPSPSPVITTDVQKPFTVTKPKASKSPKPSATIKPTTSSKPETSTSKITTESVLKALNDYRSQKGVGNLVIDSKLQEYAQSRANYLKDLGKLDKHAGHKAFMADDGFSKLGFNAIAENQSYNFKGDSQGLIENLYGKSSGHNRNQLNSEYTHVGIGISGAFTNLVFGGKKR